MKKKILSILLAICLVFGSVPAMTVQSDAIIGSILKAGFTVCKSVINGTIKTVKNIDYYDGNVGKAVLGQFKNIGADLTGLDIGETMVKVAAVAAVAAAAKAAHNNLHRWSSMYRLMKSGIR